MTGWAYLGALLVSFTAMLAVDHRWRLFWWSDRRRAVRVMATGIALFIVWDAAGILTGSFERGESVGMTGIELAPDFPLEELVFITFLCHLTMVAFSLAGRLLDGARPADREEAP